MKEIYNVVMHYYTFGTTEVILKDVDKAVAKSYVRHYNRVINDTNRHLQHAYFDIAYGVETEIHVES